MRRAKREEQIRAEGIDGRAKLLGSWIVGKSGGEIESIELIRYELEVYLPGKPPYKVNHRQLTPFAIFSSLNNGMEIPVKVNPDKPKQVMLNWDQSGMQAQSISAGDLPENLQEVIRGMAGTELKRDLKDRLRELEGAFNENLITKEEYESKRAEILIDL